MNEDGAENTPGFSSLWDRLQLFPGNPRSCTVPGSCSLDMLLLRLMPLALKAWEELPMDGRISCGRQDARNVG